MRLALLATTALVALGLAACSAAPADVGSTDEAVTKVCGASTNGPVQGYDVSVYQGNFNWQGKGVAFGYARISDGTGYIDPDFNGNWSNMKSAGVLRGAYQFFRPNEDATAQANLMIQKVGKLGIGDLPAMIDVEATGGQPGWVIAQKVRQWLQIVEAGTGRRPIIYTGSYFWQDNVGDTSFGKYPIWIAAYGPSCPSLPPGWSNWLMWQYSDGNGALDHDVFNGSIAQLKALAGATVPLGPPTAKPAAPKGCGDIKPGEGLVSGESYSSCDGRFALAMQTDGNLVLYGLGRALWSTNTYGSDGYAAIMQTDGNFVLYGKHSDPLWASDTNGHGGSTLALQTDGNLVVYSPSHVALWDSGTSIMPAPAKPTACGQITPDHGLAAGEDLASCDGHHVLAMQTDGNLVYYHDGKAIWATGTAGTTGYAAVMQGDGNFVLYNEKGGALWSTTTENHPGASLAVQGDGNLVVYSGNAPLWASDTSGR